MVYALIPLLPLIAFVVLGLGGHVIKERAHLIAVPAVLGSFLLSLMALNEVASGAILRIPLYTWANSGDLTITLGLFIDQLTVAMLLLVTIVSSLVHVYTIGYMHGEPGYARFFSNIALFTFSMLMLVMSDNFLQIFVFWEAVGLCSYLLIGHWYERESARAAATKAFLVNRIGDFGFMVGILLIFVTFGSLQYQDVFSQLDQVAGGTVNLLGAIGGNWEISVMTMICLFLFVGAVGKSAQVPLHVWLPDAMEGPTPISALIHAATMVTAGVFMVARLAPLYNLSPVAMDVVAVVGGVTMFLGATIAMTQTDIKRVVAYSTLSQLGYMMMACGLGAYVSGMYHLLTHGAFKALLFLGCGAVIIALHHEQDMRKMGGLYKYMPITWITCLVGSIALIWFPGTSGFYSKDAIIEAVHLSTLPAAGYAYVAVLSGVFITALYSFRLFFMTFHGQEKMDKHTWEHLHECPRVVTIPLLILAIPSLILGAWYAGPMLFGDHFAGAIQVAEDHAVLLELGSHYHGEWYQIAWQFFVHGISHPAVILLAFSGVFTAWLLYIKFPDVPEKFATGLSPIYRLLENKYGFDAFNQKIFAGGTKGIGQLLWQIGDVKIIDGLIVNGSALSVRWFSGVIRQIQSGYVYHYAFAMIIGLLLLLAVFVHQII
ncbi:MAG: NADH-quinone oxidoreductase subunit L [Gammaproteobacteria bacterium]|nr:NADH-quinone oxidoreductase subunit L [Gammaproteobacteria bacterium]